MLLYKFLTRSESFFCQSLKYTLKLNVSVVGIVVVFFLLNFWTNCFFILSTELQKNVMLLTTVLRMSGIQIQKTLLMGIMIFAMNA